MEASDAFAQEIGGKDPFAEEFDETFGGEAPAEEPPIVDREGNPVQYDENGTVRNEIDPATGKAAPLPPEPAQAPQNGNGAAEDPTPPAESAGPTEAAAEPEAGPTPAGSEAPPPAQAEPSAGPSAGQPDSTSANAPDAEPEASEEDAEPPKEVEDQSGRKTKRRYLIFKVDGPGKLTQVHWYEDSKGKLVAKGTGAKRQTVCLARGTDDALKFGFAALNSPQNGVKLVAVAQLHFQVRDVKPLPPEPMRQRLQIN